MKTIPRRCSFLSPILLVVIPLWLSVEARAADVNSVWNANVVGNWSVSTNWTPNANYPNNGGLTYNARVSSGTATLTEPIVLQQYTNAGGTLTGDFPLTINELFTWSGGTLSGNAPINVLAGASWTTGTKTLTGRTLNISGGTATWSAGTISSGGGALLNIGAPAIFNNTFDGQYNVTAGGSSAITNQGIFQKTGGTSGSGTSIDAVFNNQPGATVTAGGGILTLDGGGNSSGTFNISPGATLGFGGGTHVLNAGATITGAGTNRITGGSVSFAGAYHLPTGSTVVSGGTADFTGSNPRPGNLLLSGAATVVASFNSGGPAVSLSGLNLTGGTLGGSDSLDITGGFTWAAGTISGSGTVQPLSGLIMTGIGTKTLNGRTLSLPGGTTNVWLQGTINSGSGAVLNLDPLAVFNISSDSTYNLAGGSAVITNRGTLRKTGGTGVAAISPAFINLAPGVVESDSGTLSLNGGGGGDGTYTSGPGSILRFGGGTHVLAPASKVNGPGTNVVSAGSVTFAGSYDVIGGTIIGGGGATFSGTVSNVGALSVGAGTVTFDTGGAIPADSVSLAGGILGGADTMNVAGGFLWSGGRLDGSGQFNVNGGGVFTGAQAKNLNARTFNLNSGTVTWTVGTINTGGGAVVNNAALFNISFDGALNDTLGGSSTFNNSGTLRKSAGNGIATINPVFNNSPAGRVEVQSGTLNFAGGGTSSGTFDVPAGTTLSFGGGAHALDSGSSITGAGTNAVTAGSLTMNGTYSVTGGTRIAGGAASFAGSTTSVGALTVSSGTATFAGGGPVNALNAVVTGGTLSSSNTLNVGGSFNWNGGTLTGTGPINANGPLNLSGITRTFSGRLNVNNAATWTAGNINSGQGAALTIESPVLFDTTFDGSYQFILGGSSSITNRGTFQKSGGIGPAGTVINPVFDNAAGGMVNVTSGTLSLNGGGTSSGTFMTAANSTLQFGGGTHFLDGTSTVIGAGTNRVTAGSVNFGGNVGVTGGLSVSGGAASFSGTVNGGVPLLVSGGQANFNGASAITFASIALTGGSLGGSNDLTVSGPFNWNGGTLGGSGRLLANGGATFANNNHTFSGRRLTVPSGRTAAWNSGNFAADQGSTLEIAGTLDMSFDGQYFPGVSGSASIDNTGAIRKSGGNGTTGIGVPLNNNGTFEVNSGRVELSGGGAGSGGFTAAANTTLAFMPSFGSGTYNLGAGSSLQGAGTISFEGATVNFGGTYNVSGTSAFTGGTVNFTSGAAIQTVGPVPTISGSTVNFDTGTLMGFPTLTLSGGTLGGGDPVNVTNLLTWNGASLSGTNVLNAFGGVALNGNSRGIFSRRLNLFGTSTWSSGSIDVENGAVIYIQPGATLNNTFNGDVSGIVGNGGITNAGTFRKSSGGGSTLFNTSFHNAGTVEVNSGSLDIFFGTYQQTAGTTYLNGGNLSVNVLVQLLGGVLTGAGTITGPITNSGVINPGSPTGILNVTGDYMQGAAGELHIDLGGTSPGTGYDQLNLTFGTVTLDGTLSVALTNGFLPNIGDSFRVLTFGSSTRTGDFRAFTGFDLGVADRHLEAVYDDSGLTLVTRAGPLTANPALGIQLLPPSTLELTWSNQFSDFHLESTTNLVTPSWQAFGTPGTNVVFVVIDPAEPQRFFRLKKP